MSEDEWKDAHTNIEVKLSKSFLSHRLHRQDQIRHHQFLLGLFHRLFFLWDGSLEGLTEHGITLSCEDVVLTLHFLILGYLVALDGEHLEHLHLLEGTTEILDETLETLNLLQTQQSIQDLLVN
jgi:hypothetical protein